jgi:hypothetical protein
MYHVASRPNAESNSKVRQHRAIFQEFERDVSVPPNYLAQRRHASDARSARVHSASSESDGARPRASTLWFLV